MRRCDLRLQFRGATYRPVALTTGSRLLSHLVDQLDWVRTVAVELPATRSVATGRISRPRSCQACADVLDGQRRGSVRREAEVGTATRAVGAGARSAGGDSGAPRWQHAAAATAEERSPARPNSSTSSSTRRQQVGSTVEASAAADARSVDRSAARPARPVGPMQCPGTPLPRSHRAGCRPALGLAALQHPGGDRACARGADRRTDPCRSQLLGGAGCDVDPADDGIDDRRHRRPSTARHCRRVRRRRAPGRAARDRLGRFVDPAAHHLAGGGFRSIGDLFRRGSGSLHRAGRGAVQHRRSGRMVGRPGPDRGRRAGLPCRARVRPPAVAVRSGGADPPCAGRQLPFSADALVARLPASHRAVSRSTRRRPPSDGSPKPLRQQAGSTTPSGSTWPSAAARSSD